jgi:branched-chain amino acid transport system ATP-binding protein
MLEITNLSVAYGKVVAVSDLTVSAAPGQITLVLGTNGAGKTTSLCAIAGVLPVRGGSVRLNGKDITRLAPHHVVRCGLVMVPEGRKVFDSMTVEENLLLGGYVVEAHTRRNNLSMAYSMFPILAKRRTVQAGLLSGGEQQMLAFGRALMSSPTYITMDEPSMGLAPVMVEQVLASARQIADSGTGVLMVEQNAEAGLEVADAVVVMSRGTIVYRGTANAARNDPSIVRAFLGESAIGAT